MGVRQPLGLTIDREIMERARDASAFTGLPVSRIAEMALIGELAKLEAQHGKFPARPHQHLVGGNPPGWKTGTGRRPRMT
jgi:hypothetical protein